MGEVNDGGRWVGRDEPLYELPGMKYPRIKMAAVASRSDVRISGQSLVGRTRIRMV